jgi:hypothetical protein
MISELDETVVRPSNSVYERTKSAIDHFHEYIQALGHLGFLNEG